MLKKGKSLLASDLGQMERKGISYKQQKLRQKIHSLIPGGCHTYSRGDDQFPSNAPALLTKGKGCYVWGSDGKKYLDYGMGLRSVGIGYAQEEIDNAAIEEIRKGNSLTRASMTELLAAEKILKLYPGMDMVKFAKNGSTVTTASIKLARAYTGKKYAVCCSHPFFSYDDWFIGNTVVNRGVPEEYKKLTLNFSFNDIDSLKKVFREHKKEIACVIMEPTTHIKPEPWFLNEVKDITHKNDALLIFDEISCAFRVGYAAYLRYKVTPDLLTIGKAIANGYSVAALLGKKEIMDLGSIQKEGLERTFLISSTFGAEMCGLGAMMATIDFYKKHDVLNHLLTYGKHLIDGINNISRELKVDFYMIHFPLRLHYVTKDNNFRTLFMQEMIKNGVLFPWVAPSFSHKEKELKKTLDAIWNSLEVYKKAEKNGVWKYLKGKAIKPVFRRYN